jgi:hypothetical protein
LCKVTTAQTQSSKPDLNEEEKYDPV